MANRKPNLFRFGVAVLPLYLAGCVTNPGAPNTSGLQSFNVGASDISDAFAKRRMAGRLASDRPNLYVIQPSINI